MTNRSGFIEFNVPGKPRGKARVWTDGRSGRKFVDKKTRDYMDQIVWCLRQAQRAVLKPTKRPINIRVEAVFEVPVSWPKWKRQAALAGDIAPTVKPDDDNIAKIVRDALNGVLFADDQQVISSTDDKRYGEKPHLRVIVSVSDKLPAQCTKADWEHHQSRGVDLFA
ncbi:RusA family crossover junction endodeoxyribonuclease [uncultured Paraglaciecola sp.]|uniref:RusA family crossover junction endodeoxyribonuclease n=1 Tax=uncultured Paraglaciecola sp. TaxID=1765024 RepID=UPI00260BB7EE|nr:RusA family crossover junction endodeoxyribonuclease [uncultured Paraglaciecola sp.]